MEITWHGNSCFTIKTKTATAVMNPYTDGKGLKLPKLKADMVIMTGVEEGNNNLKAVEGEPKAIEWPGEYEISGAIVTATQVPGSENFFFTFSGDNVRVCYIEKIGEKLDEELLEAMGEVDVLIVPAGGEGMKVDAAHKLTEDIEPRCIIPMNYSTEGSTASLASVDEFLKLSGAAAGTTPQDKLSIAGRSALRPDQTECTVLSPQLG